MFVAFSGPLRKLINRIQLLSLRAVANLHFEDRTRVLLCLVWVRSGHFISSINVRFALERDITCAGSSLGDRFAHD
jgi:hypothetical protein